MYTMRQSQIGRVYLKLAYRFNMSVENQKLLDGFLNEPNNIDSFLGADSIWENKVRALFPIYNSDRHLFISAMWGITEEEAKLTKQIKLN